MKAQSIIGDSKHRVANDFYPTPPYAVERLLERESFQPNIWEPACGTGNISKVLQADHYTVLSTDLIDYGYGEPISRDFLLEPNVRSIHDVITNPPFNLALEFVLKSKQVANDKIALLLKTQFLEGVGRYPMFQDTTFPLKCMYQFSKRLTFNQKSGGMLSFAWFVWERRYQGEPMIRWIK